MQLPQINCNPKLTTAELFFVERSLELLSSDTIESYRLPLHNPKTLLQEVVTVINSYHSGEIKHEDYGKILIDEILTILKRETFFSWVSLTESYFKSTLGKKDLMDTLYASNILLHNNKNYSSELFSKLKAEIEELNKVTKISFESLVPLNDIITYFLVELREVGYSKVYLHRFIKAIFYSKEAGNFKKRLGLIGGLLDRKKEKFEIVVGFVVKPSIAQQLEILDSSLVKIDHESISEIAKSTNEKVRTFFSSNPNNTFYKIDIESFDYYTASNQVRRNLHLVLDVLFMGYSSEEFSLNPKCVVLGVVKEKAGVHNLNYQLDGHFKNDQKKYKEFSSRINSIRKKRTSEDALNRIEAALRYLRIGSNVEELQNKLLNYWIAMEYFFSSADSATSKTRRMREYFKRLHGKVYFKRLLMDFHKNIKVFGLHGNVKGFDPSLKYLSDEANFLSIENSTNSPLLSFRAYKLRSIMFNKNALVQDLKRHTQKVEWNIVRIYRQRNSIVHSASSDTNILDITSHLRYYLIFSINSAIDFFNNSPFDINRDGKLNLDDFFLINKTEYENLLHDENLSITNFISIKNPIEFLI